MFLTVRKLPNLPNNETCKINQCGMRSCPADVSISLNNWQICVFKQCMPGIKFQAIPLLLFSLTKENNCRKYGSNFIIFAHGWRPNTSMAAVHYDPCTTWQTAQVWKCTYREKKLCKKQSAAIIKNIMMWNWSSECIQHCDCVTCGTRGSNIIISHRVLLRFRLRLIWCSDF